MNFSPKRLSPKRRYRVSLVSGFVLLGLLGFSFHYSATRQQRRRYERRLDALEDAFSSFRSSVAVAPKEIGGQGGEAPLVNSAPSHDPPQVLGSGRSACYRWVDVRYEDGFTGRYYIQTNATRSQVRAYVSRLASDAKQHRLADDSSY